MANPGPYSPMNQPPMGGPMQPMGGPPRGPMGPMGPMGGMPQRPVRQGTSKIVPVVVSAGLAIGVFCGLLFGLGTKKVDADPSKATNGVKHTDDSAGDPSAGSSSTTGEPTKAAGSAVAVATGSTGATGAAGSATPRAGSAASAEPAVVVTKLAVDIEPAAAAETAKVYLDGKEIPGTTIEIPLKPGAKQKVKISVKSSGYKDSEQEVEVTGDTNLKFDLTKVARSGEQSGNSGSTSSAPNNTGNTGSSGAKTNTGTGGTGTGNGGNKGTGKGTGGKKGSGGLIDI